MTCVTRVTTSLSAVRCSRRSKREVSLSNEPSCANGWVSLQSHEPRCPILEGCHCLYHESRCHYLRLSHGVQRPVSVLDNSIGRVMMSQLVETDTTDGPDSP